MTLEEATQRIAAKPEWAWTAMWWRLSCIIVQTPKRTWEAKSPDDPCPNDIVALGCTGTSHTGRLDWIGYDLDVGHGTDAYNTTEEAIADAMRLRDRLNGRAEVRLSKSGQGVHVRHLVKDGEYTKDDAKKLALDLAKNVWIKLDATPLGRQAFWLWARKPGVRGFELIGEHA